MSLGSLRTCAEGDEAHGTSGQVRSIVPSTMDGLLTKMTNMVIKRTEIGVAEAKAKLSELLERVSNGERILVARRGRPVAMLVPPDTEVEAPARPRGLATLAGVLADAPDFEAEIRQVVRSRRTARDRPAPDLT
jgi:prevent-host-death family protein